MADATLTKPGCNDRRRSSVKGWVTFAAAILALVLGVVSLYGLAKSQGEWKATVDVEMKNDRATAAEALKALEEKQDVKFNFIIESVKDIQADVKTMMRRQ